MSNIIEIADKLTDLGKFGNAVNRLKDYQQSRKLSIQESSQIAAKINLLEKKIEKRNHLDIGEAFFPIFDTASSDSALCKIRIEPADRSDKKTPPKSLTENWQYVRNIIPSFLDDFLLKNNSTTVIFHWDLEPLRCRISDLPDTVKAEHIQGNSMRLAILAALLSYISNSVIKPYTAFSGDLIKHNGTLQIAQVENIKDKLTCIRSEFGKNGRLVTSALEKTENPQLEKLETPDRVINQYFPDIISKIYDFAKHGKSRYFNLFTPLPNVQSDDGFKLRFAEFNHSDINTTDYPRLAEYFLRIQNILSDNSDKGLIIDGIKPNCASALISQTLKNNCKSFVAFTDKQSGGAIVVIVSHANKLPNRELGSFIRIEKI